MRKLSPKALVVWDLDNTLTDSATFWGVATEMAVQMTIDAFGLDQQRPEPVSLLRFPPVAALAGR
ncbi:MAG: hypothetical protein HYU57_02845 [Micavibrio aeruginosavorus]|nr:hypothetical protein [Micavibrio aeruginosavorus]